MYTKQNDALTYWLQPTTTASPSTYGHSCTRAREGRRVLDPTCIVTAYSLLLVQNPEPDDDDISTTVSSLSSRPVNVNDANVHDDDGGTPGDHVNGDDDRDYERGGHTSACADCPRRFQH